MKIKKVTIKNFRGISDKEINFDCANANIIIGDNGTSKTTILEAINLCLSSGYTASQLSIKDFHLGEDNPIEINVFFDETFDIEIPDLFGNNQKLRCTGIALQGKKRDRSAPGKAFNDLVVVEHNYIPVNARGSDGWTIKRKTGSDMKITEWQLSMSYAKAKSPKVFYFGKDRTRQLKKGFNSSISNVIDDLNWRFEKKQRTLEDAEKFKHKRLEIEKHVFENTDGDTLKKTVESVNKVLKDFGITEIDISLIKSLTPYDGAELVKRMDGFELPIGQIGSGIEMITAIVFLETLAKISKEDIIIIIDEPELHLHPTLQDKLATHLSDKSEDIQIFISSHSPFFFKNCFERKTTCLLIAELDPTETPSLINAKDKGFGLLNWSPSWGEICYFAYGLATMEFHNDLYATLQDKNNTPTIKETESWLLKNNETQEISWTNVSGDIVHETIMTYIRNRIHHADNLSRPAYSYIQLEDSTKRMINLLK